MQFRAAIIYRHGALIHKERQLALHSLGIVIVGAGAILVFPLRPPGQDWAVAFNFVTITKELEDQRGCTSSQ